MVVLLVRKKSNTKQHKASYKAKLVNSINKPLLMLHMDLFGLINVKSLMKKSYCLVITDDFSRFSWVFFLATKDETSGILKTFITRIENQLDCKVKVIRCDNGIEFKNSVMNQFYDMKGIKREFSVAWTPQQNGVAERKNKTLIKAARTMKNRTLIEAAKTMLVDSKFSTTFWEKAVNTTCYALNRALVIKTHNKTPYELIRGRPPLLDFMKPFGYPVTILNTKNYLGKFDEKVDEGFFVGYSVGHTQEEGIDYDEVFAPVARIEAVRLFLAYASFKDFVVYQMDINSAFLYEKIEEEVYVCQPPGFEDPNFLNKVYKVEKDLYGLHHAPRACSMIGSLMYLTASKADITFAICTCARYLKGQPKLGLWYPRDSPFDLEAYSDSDSVGASLDRKSTTGDETVYKEWENRIERAATTASSLKAEQDSVFLDKQVEGMSKHKEIYVISSYTKKVFANMRRHRQGFSRNVTTLFKTMMVNAQEEVGEVDEAQRRMHDADMFGVDDLEGNEVFVDVREKIVKKEVSTSDPVTTAGKVVIATSVAPTTATTADVADELTLAKTLIAIKASKPKVISTSITTPRAKARLKDEENRAMIEKWDGVQAIIDADRQLAEQIQAQEREQLSIKERSKLFAELIESRRKYFAVKRAKEIRNRPPIKAQQKSLMAPKRCLEIVPEDDDDVAIEATPLSSKSPTIVDYYIYKESYFKIIRADGNLQNYLTFRIMFKNFNREYLEVLRSIVKQRFNTLKFQRSKIYKLGVKS
nr:ribonuclease H-like domain-containing protein [Tanacetum cinerariifolium]